MCVYVSVCMYMSERKFENEQFTLEAKVKKQQKIPGQRASFVALNLLSKYNLCEPIF